MAKPLTYNATLVERIDVTESLAIFKIAPDEPQGEPWFVPGQYCVLGMNNDIRPELGPVRRPMTIASAPEQLDSVEFYIRHVSRPESENPLTHLLWSRRVGDRLYMRVHAAGTFTLHDTVAEDDRRLKVMVAAGTGAAPFVSMLRSAIHREPAVDLSGYALLHGASCPAHLGYGDELRHLATRNGLRYRTTVSRATDAITAAAPAAGTAAPEAAPGATIGAWHGDIGRVEDYFLPERIETIESRLGLAAGALVPDRAVVYVCGLRGTIGACIQRLAARGFIPDHRRTRKAMEAPEDAPASLFFEQYDSSPVIDIKDPAVVAQLRAALARARSER